MDSFGTEQTIAVSTEAITSLLFLLVLIGYCIFSAILVYHWREYATNATVITRTLVLYFITTATILAVATVLWFLI